MTDQDSDSEAMSQPEVATVTKAIKNKKRNKKKRAHKLRREALKQKARAWNTTKGLLCCSDFYFELRGQFVLCGFDGRTVTLGTGMAGASPPINK